MTACLRAGVRIGLCAAALLFSAGCSSKFQAFPFQGPGSSRTDIWQSPRVSRDREARFQPAPGELSSPEYHLASPIVVSSPGEAFGFSYASDVGPISLTIFSDKARVLNSFPLPATSGTTLRYLLPLETGSRIWGYQLSASPKADSASTVSARGTMTLHGAGILPSVHGFAIEPGILTVDGSVEVLSASAGATSARLTEASRAEMGGGIWLLRLTLGDGAAGGRIVFSEPGGRSAVFEVDPASTPPWLDFARGAMPFVPRDAQFTGTLRSFEILKVRADAPIPADPGQILSWDQSSWRKPDFELFAWSRFPRVLILDMASYQVQDAFFKRLAFFVEKAGHAGTLESFAALARQHGYNAHDYRAEDLARFFNAAEKDPSGLSAEESALAGILEANGVVRKTSDGYSAGDGCVLSISRSSSPLLRSLLLTHESFHGLFFTTPAFREAAETEWSALSADEQALWLDYLGARSYNTTDHYLVVNEFQSYLLQQERTSIRGFQALVLERMRAGTAREAGLARRLAAAHPSSFLDAFDVLDGALQSAGGPPGGQSIAVREFRLP
ncbi:MAG: hypothetical protein ACLQDL_16600 [Spirochaetia bacterium]